MAKKLASDVRVYYGGYDFGTATTRVGITLGVDGLDSVTLTDSAERVLASERKDAVEWVGLFDDGTSADRAGSALVGGTGGAFNIFLGTAQGDIAYGGTVLMLEGKSPARIGELVRYEAAFKPDQAVDRGVVLANRSSLGGVGSNVGWYDNGSATLVGGVWYIHVHSYTGTDNMTLVLYSDITQAGTAQLYHGTLIASGLSGTRIAFSGTIERFAGIKIESVSGAGGTAKISSMLKRN